MSSDDVGDPWHYFVPPTDEYNGSLVVWCPSIQVATNPVGIPDELAFDGITIPNLINGLGFAFAVRAYQENGLTIDQNVEDVRRMIDIFAEREGRPSKIFLIGASGGGLVATLLLERHPEEFAGGLSACGPLGDFNRQIDYLLDARATFDVYFPDVIPGPVFDPPASLIDSWANGDFVYGTLRPAMRDPESRQLLLDWAQVAQLPFDPSDRFATTLDSAELVLSFAVLNLQSAKAYLGGLPYSNIGKQYSGSRDDEFLNEHVPRISGDAEAIEYVRDNFTASGDLRRPLMTLHTTGDPLVPHWHETQYTFKHFMNAPLVPKRIHLRIPRYGHCFFEPGETLLMFALLLLYDGDLEIIRAALDGVIDIDSLGEIQKAPNALFAPSILGKAMAGNNAIDTHH